MAGGHSLIPLMKLRLAAPAHLVDLQGIKDLKGISAEGDAVVIGATVTQDEVIGSELLATKVPILRETALQIADPQVRYCRHDRRQRRQRRSRQRHAGGHACLDATYRAHRKGRDARACRRAASTRGPSPPRCSDGEILTTIRIPLPAAGHGYAYEKQKRKIGDYATAAAAVMLTLDGGARAVAAPSALTNVADTPLFAEAARRSLVGSTSTRRP